MIPPPSLPAPAEEIELVTDVESAFYLHLEVADRPGVLAQVAELLGLQGVSVKSVVQHGLGDNARLVMVMHPVLESKFLAAVELIGRLDFLRAEPRIIRVIEEFFEAEPLALRRPAPCRAARDPRRGGHAPDPRTGRLGAHGLRGLAQVRGPQPDRLVQGPRDDRGRLRCDRGGGGGGDVRLDREHRRERRGVRRAGRSARRGDRARGQDRGRQARAGADARRARDRAARATSTRRSR